MDDRITFEPEPALDAPDPTEPTTGAPPPRRLRLVWWVLGPLLALVAAVTTTAAVVHAPYIMFAPGSATSAEPLVKVPDGSSYESKGDVLFTTVSVIRPTYLEALKGWLQHDVDVAPRKLYYGDQTDAQNQAENVQEMDDSKTRAATVALKRLGYDVKGTGVTLVDVDAASKAAKVLRANDVVVEAGGRPVKDTDDLIAVISAHKPGQVVPMTVERPVAGKKAERRTVPVTLGRKPGTDDAVIGVLISTRMDFPLKVDINSGDVGGPSAGLAWTLALLDRLTPGSITGGHRVAVTGEIDEHGRVLEIGGVGQKAVAARHEGATLFIVPSSEAAQARRSAGSMQVVGVHDLDGALHALAAIGGNAEHLGRPGAR
ncbi:MAG: PDZ domain-containing protein [Acidimicrobiia bacterium]|nr:PDZ domain-containing protein [Acidimicrobiia bacterium]